MQTDQIQQYDNDGSEDATSPNRSIKITIAERLGTDGYCVVKDTISFSDFTSLAKTLGHCEHFSDIKLRPGANSYIMTSKTVPIHNDCPLIDYIGWYCKAQDPLKGENILVDFHLVLQQLPNPIIDKLKKIKLTYPNYKSNTTEETFLLTEAPKMPNIFFAPWLIIDNNQDWLQEVLSLVLDKIRDCCFSIRLSPGQALFVDNHRILHGRNALTENSQRWLKRIWIKKHA